MRFILVAGLLACGTSAFAARTVHTSFGKLFQIEQPSDWKSVAGNAFNVVLQGPAESHEGFPVIFISFTGLSRTEFNSRAMEAQAETYFHDRQEWVKSKGGLVLQKLPYENQKLAGGIDAHLIGIDYSIGGAVHFERTTYVSCRGDLFLVKSLDLKDPDEMGTAFRVSRSFRCINSAQGQP